MVGELTVGKLCSRWRVPNRMDSDLLLFRASMSESMFLEMMFWLVYSG